MSEKLSIIIPDGTKGDKCIMPVCKCIDGMHGNRFKALVEETSKHFDKVHLVICDSLDAHNLAEKGDNLWNEAIEVSIQSANRWIRKHLHFIEKFFGEEFEVTRWDDLKTDSEFDARYKLVQKLYDENEDIKDYIHQICRTYVDMSAERIYKQGHIPNKEKMMRKSINYTLEEVAGTATYNEWFKSPVIYLGAYFEDPEIFNRKNNIDPSVNLRIPKWCRVKTETNKLSVAA